MELKSQQQKLLRKDIDLLLKWLRKKEFTFLLPDITRDLQPTLLNEDFKDTLIFDKHYPKNAGEFGIMEGLFDHLNLQITARKSILQTPTKPKTQFLSYNIRFHCNYTFDSGTTTITIRLDFADGVLERVAETEA